MAGGVVGWGFWTGTAGGEVGVMFDWKGGMWEWRMGGGGVPGRRKQVRGGVGGLRVVRELVGGRGMGQVGGGGGGDMGGLGDLALGGGGGNLHRGGGVPLVVGKGSGKGGGGRGGQGGSW